MKSQSDEMVVNLRNKNLESRLFQSFKHWQWSELRGGVPKVVHEMRVLRVPCCPEGVGEMKHSFTRVLTARKVDFMMIITGPG